MFENIIAQEAVLQIADDIADDKAAQSMLFEGARFSGKGTAALESARVFSCNTENAPWNCTCQNCVRHRLLTHPDLLAAGRRPFLREIYAAKDAVLRENIPAARTLFLRSVKKLLLRFSPALTEGDPKIGKANPLLESINEDLEEWLARAENLAQTDAQPDEKEAAKFEKVTEALIKNAAKLESEFVSDTIPVSHIRAASAWIHSAPQSNRKVLIIENAENMQDAARNSLLKTLEEPPPHAVIILTSAFPKMLLPTILSRVRPYRFVRRGEAREAEIIQRVFRARDAAPSNDGVPPNETASGLEAYFERFETVPREIVRGVSALFLSSAAAFAIIEIKRRDANAAVKHEAPAELVALGQWAAQTAAMQGLGRRMTEVKPLFTIINEKLAGFDDRETYTRFLEALLKSIASALFSTPTPRAVFYACAASAAVQEARSACETYNIAKPLALERLFFTLVEKFAG